MNLRIGTGTGNDFTSSYSIPKALCSRYLSQVNGGPANAIPTQKPPFGCGSQ
jgi:hypothetical protein